MARYEFGARDIIESPIEGSGRDALFELGLVHCSGRDGAVNYVEAHKWFNISALRGNAEAKRYRAEISAEMSKTEIARAQRMAREWLAIN